MHILRPAALIILLLLSLNNCYAASEDISKETIVFIRHGEKPRIILCSLGQLNCQGFNRALALPRVLTAKFGKPDYIFAPDPERLMEDGCIGLNSYVRPLATIEPTAIQLNMPVATPYAWDNFDRMADLLLATTYHSSLIFVAWEHDNIYLMATTLVAKLGGNPFIIPIWHEDDYDSLYILTINWKDDKGNVSFTHDYEGLNDQSSQCLVPALAKTANNRDDSCAETILIVPAAESNGLSQLNCSGLNRSLALQQVLLRTNPEIGRTIDDFFAAGPGTPSTGEADYYQRAIMTLEPVAISQARPLWVLFAYNDTNGMADYVASDELHCKTIAIAWDPAQVQQLATLIYTRAGGNSSAIPAGVPDADTIYKITIPHKGLPQFQTLSEGVSPKTTCPLPV